MLLRPGDVLAGRLDTYTVAATLNRGAYGCAHLARTTEAAWRVIKQFLPSEELSARDLAYQRVCFEREAELLTRHHSPAIVYGYEAITEGDDSHLVMEHIQGQTLRAITDRWRLERGRPFDWRRVVRLGRQLAAVLDWLHNLPGGVIYRDLKPSNIMWDTVARRLKLIDFGAARPSAGDARATQGLGTAGYAPPELYGSAELTPATDVYTLGVVLYELLCGEAPPERTPPEDFTAADPETPAALHDLILHCTRLNVAERPSTAGAVLDALRSLDADDAPPLSLPPRNLHPPLACYCPTCGASPVTDGAAYCGHDGSAYRVAVLALAPRYRPVTTVYLDRAEVQIGRRDPDAGWYPEIDLTAYDPGRHVARHHGRLVRHDGVFTFTPLTQTAATRCNGALLTSGAAVELRAGDRLELADLHATLHVRDVLDPAPLREAR
ncbi:MAG TPA: hypothetical protein DCZ72_10865 [Armatimonadetes bacterium]|nr:hypothetical protein [Armatimonadota bacterium]